MATENIRQFAKRSLATLDDLVALENASFDTDRLSRRSFRHWITDRTPGLAGGGKC